MNDSSGSAMNLAASGATQQAACSVNGKGNRRTTTPM